MLTSSTITDSAMLKVNSKSSRNGRQRQDHHAEDHADQHRPGEGPQVLRSSVRQGASRQNPARAFML
jgi:hypothetical protein